MLDIKKLLDMQKELDKTILDNAGIKEYPLENIKLALLVELGELANEWKGFKHWKKHKEINREKLLEEFADCLSFALSLENHLNQIKSTDYDEFINALIDYSGLSNITEAFDITYYHVVDLNNILSYILTLGLDLKLTLKEMEQAYLNKNKINYERQNNGY